MELFDQQIVDVRKYIAGKKERGATVREIQCSTSAGQLLEALAVPFSYNNEPFVVFQDKIFVELGNPLQGSCSMLLWTKHSDQVQDGKISVIGPDIPESKGQSIPFAQIVVVGGERLQESDLIQLERTSGLSYQLEGYMIRRMPGKVWSRISDEAGEKGFTLETLGAALMAHYKMQFAELDAIEILFVTQSKEDVAQLESIASEAKDKSLSIRKLVRTDDGEYACDDLNCSECPDQDACATIREVILIRKNGKVSEIKVLRGK